ncbi:MAG: hypothetical protein JSV10_08725 [Candidatus Zixiibacteriota bacterium]|nr:MAG: hypothetical protein JSV10_08725 [candidate division Zixibacteria bacterium]
MRIRTVLVILGLLLFILCAVGPGQAAMNRTNNINYLAPPNEHPWQDHDSPPDADTLVPDMACPTLILIGPFKVMIIRAAEDRPTPARINGMGDFARGRDPR